MFMRVRPGNASRNLAAAQCCPEGARIEANSIAPEQKSIGIARNNA
ncbi:MAG: hypothetical protein WDO13_02305 [Verrucomicrobiota bacterium]